MAPYEITPPMADHIITRLKERQAMCAPANPTREVREDMEDLISVAEAWREMGQTLGKPVRISRSHLRPNARTWLDLALADYPLTMLLSHCWTDRYGTIHGPKETPMLEEVTLTPEDLHHVINHIGPMPFPAGSNDHLLREVLRQTCEILYVTMRATDQTRIRMPRHAFTAKQWEWVRDAQSPMRAAIAQATESARKMWDAGTPKQSLGTYQVAELALEADHADVVLAPYHGCAAEERIYLTMPHGKAPRLGQKYQLTETA